MKIEAKHNRENVPVPGLHAVHYGKYMLQIKGAASGTAFIDRTSGWVVSTRAGTEQLYSIKSN